MLANKPINIFFEAFPSVICNLEEHQANTPIGPRIGPERPALTHVSGDTAGYVYAPSMRRPFAPPMISGISTVHKSTTYSICASHRDGFRSLRSPHAQHLRRCLPRTRCVSRPNMSDPIVVSVGEALYGTYGGDHGLCPADLGLGPGVCGLLTLPFLPAPQRRHARQ